MKPQKFLYTMILAWWAVATASAQSQGGGQKLEMRDVATHDALSNTLRQAQAMNPLNHFKAVEGEDKTEVYQPKGLLESSDIISFNGLTTLVPKRAILAMPESVKNRVGTHAAGSRLVQFQEFLHANRGWVTAVEVTRAQAEGKEKLPEATAGRVAKSTSLIVATYNGGPISVLPLRNPEPSEGETASDGGP